MRRPLSLLPAVLLACAFIIAAQGARAADGMGEWTFEDPAATPLTGLQGPTTFETGPQGVATTGDGALEIRRSVSSPALFYAPMPPEAFDAPLWLTVEIESWNAAGETGEGLRFGFAAGQLVSDQIVDVRIRRDGAASFNFSGRAGGSIGRNFVSDRQFAVPLEQPLDFALYYDAPGHYYAVLARPHGAAWSILGGGITSESRGMPAFLRLNVWGDYADTPDEGVQLGSMSISRTAPEGALERPEVDIPPITAHSWIVYNATADEVVASENADVPRKTASITKAMATLVILRMVEENPSILDERVTFSALAADTRGSTCDVEAGESILLRDALYAFMLPSGNDAGNALAEHFNDRLEPPPAGTEISDLMRTRANFVAEMNREAARLGMNDTIYRIPYGDGGSRDDRTTTAADLIKLARAAMQVPRFREIVATMEHSATVRSLDGSTREATWTTTNYFLGEEGFIGIKTGTTGQAGACILTAYSRDGVAFYTVVLGSDSSDYRYHDTRKLLEDHFPGGIPAPE